MKFLSVVAFVAILFTANAGRLACWVDVALLDGVGEMAEDGSYPPPASCDWNDARGSLAPSPATAPARARRASVIPVTTTIWNPPSVPSRTSSWLGHGEWLQNAEDIDCSPGHETCYSLEDVVAFVGYRDTPAIDKHTHFVVAVNSSAAFKVTFLPLSLPSDAAPPDCFGVCRQEGAEPTPFVGKCPPIEKQNALQDFCEALPPRPFTATTNKPTEWKLLPFEAKSWTNPALLRRWEGFAAWWTSHPSADARSTMNKASFCFAACTLFWCAGCLHAALRPRRHGGKVLPGTREDMSLWRRLLAVWTLGIACGGATLTYLILVMYTALGVFCYRGSPAGYASLFVLVMLGAMYSIPLKTHPTAVPIERLSHPVLKLWREYFGFSYVFEAPTRYPKNASKHNHRGDDDQTSGQTYMVAQMPHGIMPFGSLLGIGILGETLTDMNPMGGVVADALLRAPVLRRLVKWLGVRRASSASIVKMFADGFKAVGVVTGGIAEMFISWRKERIVAPRPNFARIALQEGHHIVIVFVYGVSRTHKMLYGSPGTSRKVGFPIIVGHGASLNIPYRETLKMVVSKPIIVHKVENPTQDEIATLRKRIEAKLHQLYYQHLPEWETRPLDIIRAATAPEELKALGKKATADIADLRWRTYS